MRLLGQIYRSCDSRFAVTAPGFKSRGITVTIRNGDEQKVDSPLEVGFIGETVIVDPVPIQPPHTLAFAPAPPKPTKRRWWQIFHLCRNASPVIECEKLNVLHRKMLSVLGP